MSKIIAFIGFFLSVTGFILDFSMPDWLHWVLVSVSVVALITSGIMEIITYINNKPFSFNREENIKYLEKMIKTEGKIIIFAGSLSWVDNDSIKKAMLDKKSELYLCANKDAPYLDEFRKAKVNVLTYGETDFSPNTHFTIIRLDAPNEKIAITSIEDGYKREKRLVYELHRNKDDFISNWILYAASDLFHLTQELNKGK